MIRQSIVRGIAGVQKRRAKSACDATAMLRFFRARGALRGGATAGCVLFPASVLCFPAVDPLHRQSTRAHARTHTGATLSVWITQPPLSLSRRTCPQTSIFRIFDVPSVPLSLAAPSPPLPVAFFAPPCLPRPRARFGMASHRRNR